MDIDKIYLGDCLELMKDMPDKSIDLVVTDPPYVLETEGAGFFGKKQDEYMKGCKGSKAHVYGGERFAMKEIAGMSNGINTEVLDELCRVMKKINCYFFCSQKQIQMYLDYFVNKRGCNWNLICWHKIDPIPACGNKYLSDSEYVLFFREKGVKLFGSYDTKRTFYVTKANRADKKRYGHPTCKPLDIVRNFIVNSSKEGELVLDPFIGSGTTAIAAISSKRHFMGCELDEGYFKIATERINEAQQFTKSLFEDGYR